MNVFRKRNAYCARYNGRLYKAPTQKELYEKMGINDTIDKRETSAYYSEYSEGSENSSYQQPEQ